MENTKGNITIIKSDTEDITLISNDILYDRNLSLSAVGTMCIILYLDGCNKELSVKNILYCLSEGTCKVKSSLKELSNNGYIQLLKNKIVIIKR